MIDFSAFYIIFAELRPDIPEYPQIRRKGRYASETFLRRDDARKWAQAETLVDRGLPPNRSSVARLHTFGDLVDLHIADICAVGKPPRRSKAATLATLKHDLGKEKIGHLDRHKLIDYSRKRADQGAGPVTLGIDIGVIKMILTQCQRDRSPRECPNFRLFKPWLPG